MIRNRILPALVPALLLLAACSDTDRPAGETTTTVAGGELEGTVTVLAAASLTDAFAEIADAFEADHEGVAVELTFDGSAKLATVIVEGAPADVFASADEASMEKVADDDLLAGAASIFATNKLQIVVPAGNPFGISSLDDLIDLDVTLSLCRATVPCGRYAAEAFDKAGLHVPPTGVQDSVKGVLTQVQLGEADAGIVYATDVQAAEDVEGIDLAPDHQIEATYTTAAIAGGPNPEGAAAFVAFLTGDTAQSILEAHGFGPRRTDRDEFADYLPNLLAVSAASNLRKSDKDAAEWFPSRADANCLWASTVVHVKDQWKLAVDPAEADALGNLLRTCPD